MVVKFVMYLCSRLFRIFHSMKSFGLCFFYYYYLPIWCFQFSKLCRIISDLKQKFPIVIVYSQRTGNRIMQMYFFYWSKKAIEKKFLTILSMCADAN